MIIPSVIETLKYVSLLGSYCSPIDKTPLRSDIYSNRLKKDVNFYREIIKNNINRDKIDYTVGKYKQAKIIIPYSEIIFSDFDTLSDYRLESRQFYTKV